MAFYDKEEYLELWNYSKKDKVITALHLIYVDITDDLNAGLLLSQILYWILPNKRTKNIKLRVTQEGKYWLAKKDSDWWDEIRLTEAQAKRARKILSEKGLIITKVFKFKGIPQTHIRVNFTKLWNKIDKYHDRPIEQKMTENDDLLELQRELKVV